MTQTDDSPLGRLGRFAYWRRGTVVLLWLAALLATPSQSNAVVTAVVHTDAGVTTVRDEVTELLGELGAVPHVVGADDPRRAQVLLRHAPWRPVDGMSARLPPTLSRSASPRVSCGDAGRVDRR